MYMLKGENDLISRKIQKMKIELEKNERIRTKIVKKLGFFFIIQNEYMPREDPCR